MTQQQAARAHHLTFNTDGRPHPLENTLVAVTAALGLAAIITAGFHSLHAVSTATGLAGVLTGGFGQFISVTTAERYVLIIGLGLAGLGLYLGAMRGGFW